MSNIDIALKLISDSKTEIMDNILQGGTSIGVKSVMRILDELEVALK